MSALPLHTTAFIPDVDYGKVHIWGGFLHANETEINALAQLLSPQELRQTHRFHFEKDRVRYILRHGILRILLGIYSNADPADLEIDCGEFGKPFMAGQSRARKIEFNLSHSEGFFLIGITRDAQLGIDVERMQDISEMGKIAEQYFSKNESRVFRQLHPNQRKEAFYNCWTRKEAFVKATGRGLSQPLDSFEVSLIPGEPARLLSLQADPQAPSHWTFLDLKPLPDFAAALAIERPIRKLHIWLDEPAREKEATSEFSKTRLSSLDLQTLNLRTAFAR